VYCTSVLDRKFTTLSAFFRGPKTLKSLMTEEDGNHYFGNMFCPVTFHLVALQIF
jgi:hypothetical protein